MMTFETLGLAPAIVKAVHEIGYTAPTPIQQQAIPLVLEGRDLLGGAQTGTGKTAAFTLPMLHLLNSRPAPRSGMVRALVLCPTRELAAQVEESVRDYGKYLDMASAVIFGGVGMQPQISRIKKGLDILVATPGRLLDLHGQGVLDLSGVEILVLDEADRMLDMGFIHDVKKILALLPADKQSLLFSATFSGDIRELAASLLRNPQQVQVTPPNTTVQRIAQTIYPVGRSRKKDLLAHIIQQNGWNQVLVFTRTKFGANHVAEYLNKHGISAMALHGNKARRPAPRRWRTSRVAPCAPWLPPTLPHAVLILMTCHTSSTMKFRTYLKTMCTVSDAPAAQAPKAKPSASSAWMKKASCKPSSASRASRSLCRRSKVSVPKKAKRPNPLPWAGRPSGAEQAPPLAAQPWPLRHGPHARK